MRLMGAVLAGGIALAGTAEVFVQMNVKHPMQCVLDLPMRSGEFDRLLRRQQR